MADAPDHYQLVLNDLLARRAKLDAAISAIQEAMGMGGGAVGSASAVSGSASGNEAIRADSFFGMTVGDAARKYLAISKRTKTAQEITDALKAGGYTFATGTPLATVTSTMHRMDAKNGEIVRVTKGTWGLAEWYPGRGKRGKGADKNGVVPLSEPPKAEDATASDDATDATEKS